jgi:hypothetical protein
VALDDEAVTRLLALKDRTGVSRQPRTNPAIGPLRYSETERRCSSRGCGSMTHYAVQGAPKCTIHALTELNEMLVHQGFRGIVTSTSSRMVPRPTLIPEGRIVCATGRYKAEVGWALSRLECIHGIQLDKECGAC